MPKERKQWRNVNGSVNCHLHKDGTAGLFDNFLEPWLKESGLIQGEGHLWECCHSWMTVFPQELCRMMEQREDRLFNRKRTFLITINLPFQYIFDLFFENLIDVYILLISSTPCVNSSHVIPTNFPPNFMSFQEN